MKKRPEITLSVGGYDCSGDSNWTSHELRIVAAYLLRAAEAIDKKEHGCLEAPKNLVHIGIDFGGPFDEDKGLPKLKMVT